MTGRTNCIDRAGVILISCIWVEKRLIDLIILKQHPRLIKKCNQSNSKVKLPYTFIKERIKFWEKDFYLIKNDFIELFNPSKNWLNILEGIYDWRNIIGHSYISLYRDYLLYRPNGKKKKINRLIKNHIINKPKNPAKPFLLTLKLGDDNKYEKILKIIEDFDQIYLKNIAESLGINYEKIR